MSNPNNPIPGLPSTELEIMNWEDAQARSQINSDNATQEYNAAKPAPGTAWPLGQGSITPGSYTTNGKLPNQGNTP